MQFTINPQKLRRFRIRQTLYISFYLLVEILLLSLLFLPLLKTENWIIDSWWKLLYFIVVVGDIVLVTFTIRLLIIIQQYTKHIRKSFSGYQLEIEDDSLQVEANGEVLRFKLHTLKLTNIIVNGNLRHPFFGHGALVLEGSSSLILPTIIFDTSVGSYKARDLLKPMAGSYEEERVSVKTFLVKLNSQEVFG